MLKRKQVDMPWHEKVACYTLLLTILINQHTIALANDISGCCTRILITSDGEAINHQGNRVGEYALSGIVADRPMFKHVDREEYLFYLMSRNKGLWMVGPKVNQFNGGLAHRGDTVCVESVAAGEWKYTDGKAWHVDPRLNVTCMDKKLAKVECAYRDGVQFVGGDLPEEFGGGGIVTSSESSDECIKECVERNGCLYWSWVEKDGPNCFLKFDKVRSVRVPKFVSGSIPDACVASGPSVNPGPQEPTCSYPDVEFEGGDVESLTVEKIDDCRKQCVDTESCQLFTFYPEEPINCHLKSESARARVSTSAISGSVTDDCKDKIVPSLNLIFNSNEINGKFKMDMPFIEEYRDPTTPEYQKLAADMEKYVGDMLDSEPGFGEQAVFEVNVVSFTPGSVVCNFKVNYVLREAYLAIPFAIKPTNITTALNQNFKFRKGILFQKFLIVAGSFKASSPVDHCAAKGCSHKCDYDYSLEEYVCTCPPALVLNLDEKTCVQQGMEDTVLTTEKPEIEITLLPSDCLWSAWSQWSDCDCKSGQSKRERTVVTPNKNGGKCSGEYMEVSDCDTNMCRDSTESPDSTTPSTDIGTPTTNEDVSKDEIIESETTDYPTSTVEPEMSTLPDATFLPTLRTVQPPLTSSDEGPLDDDPEGDEPTTEYTTIQGIEVTMDPDSTSNVPDIPDSTTAKIAATETISDDVDTTDGTTVESVTEQPTTISDAVNTMISSDPSTADESSTTAAYDTPTAKAADNSSEAAPADYPSTEDVPIGASTTEAAPADDTTTVAPPGDDLYTKDVPADNPPTEDVPVVASTTEAASAADTTTDATPSDDPSAKDVPADNSSTEDVPADNSSTEDVPVGASTTESVPADDPSTAATPGYDPTTEDVPVGTSATEVAPSDTTLPDSDGASFSGITEAESSSTEATTMKDTGAVMAKVSTVEMTGLDTTEDGNDSFDVSTTTNTDITTEPATTIDSATMEKTSNENDEKDGPMSGASSEATEIDTTTNMGSGRAFSPDVDTENPASMSPETTTVIPVTVTVVSISEGPTTISIVTTVEPINTDETAQDDVSMTTEDSTITDEPIDTTRSAFDPNVTTDVDSTMETSTSYMSTASDVDTSIETTTAVETESETITGSFTSDETTTVSKTTDVSTLGPDASNEETTVGTDEVTEETTTAEASVSSEATTVYATAVTSSDASTYSSSEGTTEDNPTPTTLNEEPTTASNLDPDAEARIIVDPTTTSEAQTETNVIPDDTTLGTDAPTDDPAVGEHTFECQEMKEGDLNTSSDQIPMDCTETAGESRRRVFLVINKSQVDPETLFAKNVKVVVKDLMVMKISPESSTR